MKLTKLIVAASITLLTPCIVDSRTTLPSDHPCADEQAAVDRAGETVGHLDLLLHECNSERAVSLARLAEIEARLAEIQGELRELRAREVAANQGIATCDAVLGVLREEALVNAARVTGETQEQIESVIGSCLTTSVFDVPACLLHALGSPEIGSTQASAIIALANADRLLAECKAPYLVELNVVTSARVRLSQEEIALEAEASAAHPVLRDCSELQSSVEGARRERDRCWEELFACMATESWRPQPGGGTPRDRIVG